MAFMQKQITSKRTWLEIDGNAGITFVDADDAPEVIAIIDDQAGWDAGEDEQKDRLLEAARTYYDGREVYEVQLREGYGARLSAPGYMDCTDWTVCATAEEAEADLSEMYDDDSEDSEDGE